MPDRILPPEVTEDIRALLTDAGVTANQDLVARIIATGVGLGLDDTDRLDLKITSAALTEMRAAFRLFAPYRDVSKVTIFGSARTRPDDALYRAAVDVAAALAARGWFVVTGAGPRKVDEPVEVRPPLETRPRTDGRQHLFDEALGGRGRRLVAIGDDSSVVRVDRHRDHRGAERQHDVIRWSDPPRATPGAPQFSIAEILLSRSASGKEDEAPPLADQDRPS